MGSIPTYRKKMNKKLLLAVLFGFFAASAEAQEKPVPSTQESTADEKMNQAEAAAQKAKDVKEVVAEKAHDEKHTLGQAVDKGVGMVKGGAHKVAVKTEETWDKTKEGTKKIGKRIKSAYEKIKEKKQKEELKPCEKKIEEAKTAKN